MNSESRDILTRLFGMIIFGWFLALLWSCETNPRKSAEPVSPAIKVQADAVKVIAEGVEADGNANRDDAQAIIDLKPSQEVIDKAVQIRDRAVSRTLEFAASLFGVSKELHVIVDGAKQLENSNASLTTENARLKDDLKSASRKALLNKAAWCGAGVAIGIIVMFAPFPGAFWIGVGVAVASTLVASVFMAFARFSEELEIAGLVVMAVVVIGVVAAVIVMFKRRDNQANDKEAALEVIVPAVELADPNGTSIKKVISQNAANAKMSSEVKRVVMETKEAIAEKFGAAPVGNAPMGATV